VRTSQVTSAAWKSLLFAAAVAAAGGCSGNTGTPPAGNGEIETLRMQIKTLSLGSETVGKNLAVFDTLDFVVFNRQQWLRLHESHAADVKVFWPDGHMTQGLDVHMKDLSAMFVYAPDTRVQEHSISFGAGRYTAVTGVFAGTFTKPMPFGNGRFMQPTRKAFKIPMATICVWENGLIVEEHLFWDNEAYMKQIGLGK
jgi:hypothetical protein